MADMDFLIIRIHTMVQLVRILNSANFKSSQLSAFSLPRQIEARFLYFEKTVILTIKGGTSKQQATETEKHISSYSIFQPISTYLSILIRGQTYSPKKKIQQQQKQKKGKTEMCHDT